MTRRRLPPIDLFDIVPGVALFEQGSGEDGEFVVGFESFRYAADTVVVGADADVVDAADLDSVVDVGDYVFEYVAGGTAAVASSSSLSMAAARAMGSAIF